MAFRGRRAEWMPICNPDKRREIPRFRLLPPAGGPDVLLQLALYGPAEHLRVHTFGLLRYSRLFAPPLPRLLTIRMGTYERGERGRGHAL